MVGYLPDGFYVVMMVEQMDFLFSEAEGGFAPPPADPPSLFAPLGQTNKKPDYGFSMKKAG